MPLEVQGHTVPHLKALISGKSRGKRAKVWQHFYLVLPPLEKIPFFYIKCRAGGTRITGVARATPVIKRFTMNELLLRAVSL